MPKFKPGKRSSDPNTATAHVVKLATGQLPPKAMASAMLRSYFDHSNPAGTGKEKSIPVRVISSMVRSFFHQRATA